jgi:hypothetical protein
VGGGAILHSIKLRIQEIKNYSRIGGFEEGPRINANEDAYESKQRNLAQSRKGAEKNGFSKEIGLCCVIR